MHRPLFSLPLLALLVPAAAAEGNVSSFCTPGANGATLAATGSTDFKWTAPERFSNTCCPRK